MSRQAPSAAMTTRRMPPRATSVARTRLTETGGVDLLGHDRHPPVLDGQEAGVARRRLRAVPRVDAYLAGDAAAQPVGVPGQDPQVARGAPGGDHLGPAGPDLPLCRDELDLQR